MLKLLGLINRSNKLLSGTDVVLDGIRNNKVHFIIVSGDATDNTKKMITDKANFYHVDYYIGFTSDELSHAAGKRGKKVFGITDLGFAKKIKEWGDENGK